MAVQSIDTEHVAAHLETARRLVALMRANSTSSSCSSPSEAGSSRLVPPGQADDLQELLSSVDAGLETPEGAMENLRGRVRLCATKKGGQGLLVRLIDLLPVGHAGALSDELLCAPQLASHRYGSRVLERLILRHGGAEGDVTTRVCMRELLEHVQVLSTDKFGRRIVQAILERGEDIDRQRVLDVLCDDLLFYATDRYGSHILARLLELGQKDIAVVLADNCDELAESPAGCRVLHALLCADPVVQGRAQACRGLWRTRQGRALIKSFHLCGIEQAAAPDVCVTGAVAVH